MLTANEEIILHSLFCVANIIRGLIGSGLLFSDLIVFINVLISSSVSLSEGGQWCNSTDLKITTTRNDISDIARAVSTSTCCIQQAQKKSDCNEFYDASAQILSNHV